MEIRTRTDTDWAALDISRRTAPRRYGMLFVVSGPSGVGKGTLVNELLKLHPELAVSISVTTRQPRPSERDNVDYFFKTEDEFRRMVENGDLLEYSQFVTGTYYGTPRQHVEDMINSGRDIVLEIDVQGAIQVKERIPNGVYIFVLPPTMEELEARLKKRRTEASEAIRQRLSVAVDEMSLLPFYDYQVVNDDLDQAARRLGSIVTAERCRVARHSPR